MHILLFGAAGQVGTDCVAALKLSGYKLTAVTRQDIDFADSSSLVPFVLSAKPDVVINACAYTAVDNAESDSLLADKVNHVSVGSLASACADINAVLIHISTDYVFDGLAAVPYKEIDPVNPLGVYGRTKCLGEHAVADNMGRFVILRTSWVFGKSGNNFVKTMLRLGAERDSLSIVADQIGRPTYVGHIVDVIIELLAKYQRDSVLPWGIYHCCSEGSLSWYEFAQAIFEMAARSGVLAHIPDVKAISSSAYPTPAPRPTYSVLNTDKLEHILKRPMPSWQSGLESFFSLN